MIRSMASEVRMLPPTGEATWVEVGCVRRPHGLRGGLLVELHGDDPANLISAGDVLLEGRAGRACFHLRQARAAGHLQDGRARIRLILQGVGSREDAEPWRGARLSIRESALLPLPEGEFYWRDLLGLRCRGPEGTVLGVIEEIWPTGSNDVLVVRDGARQHLIPALREVLVRLDREAGELWVDPPAGLLEEE